MVDLFSRHDNSTFKTQLSEGMLRSVLVTDPLPCTTVSLLRRFIPAVLFILSIPTKVITGVNTRWSYANVWDPKSINGGAPKYSVSLIIPKSDTATVAKIKAAIQAAYEEGQSKLKGNGEPVPALSDIKTPLRDGDLERPDDEAYKNAYFINANSATAPGIVDADRQPILERSEVYFGVYGRASINLYAFNSNGNKGIACGLNNFQKIRDGEPLGGKSRAEDDFATADDEDDFLD